jgi:septal ring factor EnvC (AmiA/AmiB activator)
MPDRDDKIVNKIDDLGERITRLEVKVAGVRDDVKHIREEDTEQNRLLAEHIEGVKTNKQRLDLEIQARKEYEEDLKKRVESLEQVPKFLSMVKKIAIFFSALAGAVSALGWFFNMW